MAFPLGYLTNAVLRSYTAHILLALPPLLVGAVVFLLKNSPKRVGEQFQFVLRNSQGSGGELLGSAGSRYL